MSIDLIVCLFGVVIVIIGWFVHAVAIVLELLTVVVVFYCRLLLIVFFCCYGC